MHAVIVISTIVFAGGFMQLAYIQYATLNMEIKKLSSRKQELESTNSIERYSKKKIMEVKSQLTALEDRQSKIKKVSLLLILIAPAFISGSFSFLLDAAMRLANIRIDSPSILVYVNNDYAELIPSEIARNEFSPKKPNYQAFSNVQVLFTGIGSSSYISYKSESEKTACSLAIPNDKLIIIRPSKI
jgi:hypothetical protein